MRISQLSPLRRFRLGQMLVIVALLWGTAACSLNQLPESVGISGGPPIVQLASPATNATYLEGVPVNIQASVLNAGEDIDRVEVTVDDAIVTTLAEPNENGLPVFSVAHTWPADGVGSHTVGVTAFRADGSASEPATVTINVLSPSLPTEEIVEPTERPDPTATPEEDEGNGDSESTDEVTADADGDAEATSDEGSGGPIATFTQGVNVRSGPGTNFNPPIGSFAANQTADVLGRNPAGDWYKVRYYNAEGWVFASLVEVSGDTSDLPVDPGPPTPVPTPVPPTAVPATAVPQSQANLVAGIIRLSPESPVCRQTFNVRVDLANLGTEATTASGTFTVQDIVNGQVQEETQGAIPIIEAGQTVESGSVPITVDTHFDETHTIVVMLNPNGSIPESNSGDNRAEHQYTLGKGDC